MRNSFLAAAALGATVLIASAIGQVTHTPIDATPYYITISKLSFGSATKPVAGAEGMVAPFGNRRLPLKGEAHAPGAGTPIVFTTINDYGAGDAHKGSISQ